MSVIVASDAYPMICRFLKDCGLSESLEMFMNESGLDDDVYKHSTYEHDLIVVYSEYIHNHSLNHLVVNDRDGDDDVQTTTDNKKTKKKKKKHKKSSEINDETNEDDDVKSAENKKKKKKKRKRESEKADDDDDEQEQQAQQQQEQPPVKKGKKKKKKRKSKHNDNSSDDGEGVNGEVEDVNGVDAVPTPTVSVTTSAPNTPAGHQRSKKKTPRVSNTPFQRVKADQVVFADPRLRDNSYKLDGYGRKFAQTLGAVRGKGFRHEKTKKKRSFRGGSLDLSVRSVKF